MPFSNPYKSVVTIHVTSHPPVSHPNTHHQRQNGQSIEDVTGNTAQLKIVLMDLPGMLKTS